MFYSKGEATNFNADITNDVNFRPFNYKARLLENTVADGADKILENATIFASLR